MTLMIQATTLAAALKGAAAIVETKNTLPILAMVMFDGKTITTSNLDIEYRQTLEADGELSCAVDANRLSQWANVAKGTVTMTVDGHILNVKAGRSRLALPVLPIDDFPIMPVDKLSSAVKVDGGLMASHLRRVVWAASTETTRYYLNGVFLNNQDGHARFVSTDGHRLASITSSTKWPKGAPDVILPTKLVDVIANSSTVAGNISMAWDASKLRAIIGNVTITGKMIEGNFPDYRRVIPDCAVSNPVAVDVEEFASAIKRVRIASDAQQRKVRISASKGTMELKIEGTSGFEGEEEITADCDNEFQETFNADYLTTILNNADVETFVLEQKGKGEPCLFRPISQSVEASFIGVVMPIRS